LIRLNVFRGAVSAVVGVDVATGFGDDIGVQLSSMTLNPNWSYSYCHW
jgi:hypothetical protein